MKFSIDILTKLSSIKFRFFFSFNNKLNFDFVFIKIKMFPCDRFGVVHIVRIILELAVFISMYIFGSCHHGFVFSFDYITSIIYFTLILLMTVTDVYYLLLAIFTIEVPQRKPIFHIVFYTCMSLLALVCCVFSIIAFIFCLEKNNNRLCYNHSCGTLWISIVLTFLLTIMYSGTTKLFCCLNE